MIGGVVVLHLFKVLHCKCFDTMGESGVCDECRDRVSSSELEYSTLVGGRVCGACRIAALADRRGRDALLGDDGGVF